MRERVLIVGALSPLGQAVTGELATMGHDLFLTSRAGGAGFESLDVADRDQTIRVLERVRPTAVIYLARPALGASPDVHDAVSTAIGALRLFSAQCGEFGVGRILFASSAAVYGTEAMAPLRESDPALAASPYAQLKLGSESALAEVAASGAITAIAFRIFNIYGPGFSGSLVNRLATGDGPPPLVQDTDRFVRDYIHVRDVARGFGAALALPKLDATIVNLGSGVGTTNRALLELCPHAIYQSDSESTPSSFSVANIELARSSLGFEPRIRLEVALGARQEFLRGKVASSGD